jgi:hypothetical protein
MAALITPPEQQVNSYAVNFQITSAEYPGSVSTITIYKNDDPLYTFTTTAGGQPETYTFAEPTSASVIYSVGGVANSESYEDYQIAPTYIFTVDEYKPTFTLPVIQCAKKGEPFSFFPTAWNMNSNVCPNTPLDSQVTYERYEFNMNTSQYELKGTPVVIDMTGEDGVVTGSDYAYVPDGEDSWIPDKLTMVKFVVKVQNCSTEIEKSTVFPICGGWKIRRIACGNYRIYNYTQNPITFSFTGPSVIPDKTIIPFNYDTLQIDVDGIYQVTDNAEVETLQYIFNYCALESCVLAIQKKILLDETLCDDCKMDKVLYQKALRLLSVYETWKKLLDKDWVYNIQYASTDIDNELSRIYDAEELYKELIKFCDDCGDTPKKCNC